MRQYWAAKPTDEIAKAIMGKVTGYKKYLESSGILKDLRKSYFTYYTSPHIKDVDQSLKAICVNHYANLIRHVHVMATSQRPAWEPMAVNTDSKSQDAATLAAGVLDYFMREKRLEKEFSNACEKALFLREGWLEADWDALLGDPVAADDENPEKPINSGDPVIRSYTLVDVARDVRRKNMKHQWYVTTSFENKWDLAAQYPELAEKITAIQSPKDDFQFMINNTSALKAIEDEQDLIPVYTLKHGKTPALPQGRQAKVLNDDILLMDGPLPTKRPYMFCMTGSDKFEEAFGFSQQMDQLPIQNAQDMTISSILTNVAANAVQNFQVPKGAAPTVVQVMDGMNVVEYDPKAGKMEPMDLLKTAPEVYKFFELLVAQQELISGVSQISRGMAPATMSGQAMALLQQQAIQFASGLQLHYTMLIEDVGTALIELLQQYAVEPRIAMIVGKTKRSMLKKYKGSDLEGVSRVFVNQANPLTKTAAGRVEIANTLLNAPPPVPGSYIKTPDQYIGVLTTGNLEPLYQADNMARLNVVSENERLMEGAEVVAMVTDDHPTHILEHASVLSSPEARENPQAVQAVTMHIQEHLQMAKMMDPALALVLKQQSLYQPPAPPPPQGGDPEQAAEIMDNQNPITAQAEQTQLPQPAQPPGV